MTTAPAAWLEQRRLDAVTARGTTDPPSVDEEVWRYSRIADLDLSSFDAADGSAGDVPAVEAIDGAAATVLVHNGVVVSIDADDTRLAGATVRAASAASEPIELGVMRRHDDPISVFHDAALRDAVVVDVPRGAMVDGPVVIESWVDAPDAAVATHTVVTGAAGAHVTVLERRRSSGATQVVFPEVELAAARDARVSYLAVQQLGRATSSIEQQWSDADEQAHVVAAVAAFGGDYARVRADFRLSGRGASGDLLSVYFGDGDQMLDFRTFQDHEAPDTTSNLLFKGAVTGEASSVYSGLIRVSEDAPGTNAFQTNRNLKLSDDAWAYSVPNLEIEQNQVACSHASTVGEIDELQLFYLESRGVPTTVAEQLLVSGFFAEVIDQLPVPQVRAELRSIVDAALEADRAEEAS